ncbi:MAG: sensor domain-containing diguanylate cyclase [Spirochaetota bacterium]
MVKPLQLLNVLNDFSENLRDANYSDINHLYSLTVLYCAEYLMCTRASFLRYNKEEQILYHGATVMFNDAREMAVNIEEKLKHITIPFKADYRASISLEPETTAVSDVAKHPNLSRVIDDALGITPKHALFAPLYLNDEFIGIIEAVRASPSDDFDSTDRVYFSILTNFVATLLSGIRSSDWAIRDALTGIYNVNFFKQTCDQLITENERRQHEDSTFCVAMIDIDNFKTINDTYGHKVGDLVLRHVVQVIAACLRKNDVLARFGGDEFCIVFKGCPMTNARIVCERILERIRNEKTMSDDKVIPHSISIGVAEYRSHGTKREDIMHFADIAMYRSKNRGKNCYTIYSSEMGT